MDTDDASAQQDLTPQQRDRLSRDRRWRLWLLAMTPVFVLGGLVAAVLVGHSQRPDRPVPWLLLVSLGLAAVVLVALAALIAMRLRSGSSTTRRLVLSGDRATIRRVGRSLTRGEPVADDDLEVARALVAQQGAQRWSAWAFGGSAVLTLASVGVSLADADPSPVGVLVLRAVGGVGVLVGAVLIEVNRRRLLRGAERAGLRTEP